MRRSSHRIRSGLAMRIMQHQRELMQRGVAKAFGFDRLDGRQHIIAVVSGAAVSLLHDAKLFGERQAAGILNMAAIGDIGQRADPFARLIAEPNLGVVDFVAGAEQLVIVEFTKRPFDQPLAFLRALAAGDRGVRASGPGVGRARRDGRFLYYSPNFPRMNALLGFLTENCCVLADTDCGPSCGPACEPVVAPQTQPKRKRA